MFQEYANEPPKLRIRDPLLHRGMVAVLEYLDCHDIVSMGLMHSLCHRTADDQCVVYRQVDDNGIDLRINHRENPGGRTRPMILSALVNGKGWNISHSFLIISRDLMPEAYIARLSDPEFVSDARGIIDHPYLTGTWAGKPYVKDKEISLTLKRGKPRHVLTDEGIVSLKFLKE